MADSKQAKLSDSGLMVAAMAYRVKYRKVKKMSARVESMGVHKKNRGGVYPAGPRCKSLCANVVEVGFLKEEVNHACIAVEEAPMEELPILRKCNEAWESASSYNITESKKDELLIDCFKQPYDDVRYQLLSHNHVMLVLRAFLNEAKWDLADDTERNITFCDHNGRLSVSAVAASPNGVELQELLNEGVQVEVLSWRMDVEEVTAAAIISEALNSPQQLAMRTTELTAVAVLKGEIIVQMGKDLSQRVAFQTVRDRVRAQLHTAADDPDLPEVFDFLISNGVGRNCYIDHLLEWTSRFVDCKKRQLRFSAFAVLNKMCPQAVWSKVAVVKRAYRKKPINGFCPSPEPSWGECSWDKLEKLEELLRFFHGSCKGIVDKMQPQSRIQLLGNIDIAAAEAFFNVKPHKSGVGAKKIEESLLAGTVKYLAPLGLEGDDQRAMGLSGVAQWIVFKKDAEPEPTATATATEDRIAPAVIHFDELSGQQLSTQVDFTQQQQQPKTIAHTPPQKLPWREWHTGIASRMGDVAADKSAAVAVLHNIFQHFRVTMQPIEVWRHENRGHYFVTATRKVTPWEILLPPCIPKQSKVFDRSGHPLAVEIQVEVRPPLTGGAADGTQGTTSLRTASYFVHPEFAMPKKREVAAAVAGAIDSGVAADASTNGLHDQWVWTPDGETMPPFWAVRRMTNTQLTREVALHTKETDKGKCDKVTPRFNCKMEIQALSCVTVGVVNTEPLNTTRICKVPFLVNSLELEEGEELILEIQETKKEKAQPKRTWRQAFDEQQKQDQKGKRKPGGSS